MGNTITGCSSGVLLYGANNNIVTENTLSGNTIGINLGNASYLNNITRNMISDNSDYGMYIGGVSNRITAYNNNFINNGTQVGVGSTTANNVYSFEGPTEDPVEIGGNYWDDWTGTDTDGDGCIDDNPRPLPAGTDYHPIVSPWSQEMAMIRAIIRMRTMS